MTNQPQQPWDAVAMILALHARVQELEKTQHCVAKSFGYPDSELGLGIPSDLVMRAEETINNNRRLRKSYFEQRQRIAELEAENARLKEGKTSTGYGIPPVGGRTITS